MKAVFVLGSVSRNAAEEGETISDADMAALEAISDGAGVDASIVLACHSPPRSVGTPSLFRLLAMPL